MRSLHNTSSTPLTGPFRQDDIAQAEPQTMPGAWPAARSATADSASATLEQAVAVTPREAPRGIARLPNEILLETFQHLTPSDLMVAGSVCRDFRDIAQSFPRFAEGALTKLASRRNLPLFPAGEGSAVSGVFQGYKSDSRAAAFSADSKSVVIAYKRELYRFDLFADKSFKRIHPSHESAYTFRSLTDFQPNKNFLTPEDTQLNRKESGIIKAGATPNNSFFWRCYDDGTLVLNSLRNLNKKPETYQMTPHAIWFGHDPLFLANDKLLFFVVDQAAGDAMVFPTDTSKMDHFTGKTFKLTTEKPNLSDLTPLVKDSYPEYFDDASQTSEMTSGYGHSSGFWYGLSGAHEVCVSPNKDWRIFEDDKRYWLVGNKTYMY